MTRSTSIYVSYVSYVSVFVHRSCSSLGMICAAHSARPRVVAHSASNSRSRAARLRTCVVRAAKTTDGPKIAIVGVTGAVGQEFLRVRAGMTTQDRCRLPMSSSPPPTRPSRAVSLVITPSQHHHNTITTPSQHHHNTITIITTPSHRRCRCSKSGISRTLT